MTKVKYHKICDGKVSFDGEYVSVNDACRYFKNDMEWMFERYAKKNKLIDGVNYTQRNRPSGFWATPSVVDEFCEKIYIDHEKGFFIRDEFSEKSGIKLIELGMEQEKTKITNYAKNKYKELKKESDGFALSAKFFIKMSSIGFCLAEIHKMIDKCENLK